MPRRWFSAARWSVPRLPHCIEAELISALGRGTNLDVAAADQSRPSATRTARPIHPMRCIFIPHLGKIGLAYFSPCECEVAHTIGLSACGCGQCAGRRAAGVCGRGGGRGLGPCPAPPGLRAGARFALASCSRVGDFRHFVTPITGGGWVLCEVKALSHGTKGQSNGYHRFGYYRRDRIRRLVGLYGCAVEGWEGGCACGVGPDLTACDYVAVASRRNTGRILTERYRGFRANL